MQYRHLGHSGLKVSTFSIGSWLTFGGQVGLADAKRCIDKAISMGVNFIDNAEVYAGGMAELTIGEIIKRHYRPDLVISSKVFWGGQGANERGLSRKHIIEACNDALRRLNTDYLDLYFCHRFDPNTPLNEVCETMDILIKQGKILYWGTSEWTAEQLLQAYDICEKRNLIKPTMEQPEYNLLRRKRVEQELAPLCQNNGLGTTIWSPLASGLLTGKYNNGIPENSRARKGNYSWLNSNINDPEKMNQIRQFCSLAKELQCSPAQLALAWCAHSPYVSTVITGASSERQVEENLQALSILEILQDQAIVDRINQIFPYE